MNLSIIWTTIMHQINIDSWLYELVICPFVSKVRTTYYGREPPELWRIRTKLSHGVRALQETACPRSAHQRISWMSLLQRFSQYSRTDHALRVNACKRMVIRSHPADWVSQYELNTLYCKYVCANNCSLTWSYSSLDANQEYSVWKKLIKRSDYTTFTFMLRSHAIWFLTFEGSRNMLMYN